MFVLLGCFAADLERMYAKRAKSVKTIEVEGASHCVYITHQKDVADLIIAAAVKNN